MECRWCVVGVLVLVFVLVVLALVLVLMLVGKQYRLEQTTQGRGVGLPSSTAMDDDAMGIQPARQSPNPQIIRPDWPRLIKSARAVSGLMLGAFLEYVMRCRVTEKQQVAKPYSIEHRRPQRMRGPVPSIFCFA